MTPAQFKERHPQFGCRMDEEIAQVIDLAAPFFDVDRWDDLLDEGMAAWVAHTLVCRELDKALLSAAVDSPDEVGATKRRAGDTEISTDGRVVVAQMQGSAFLRTNHGQYYLTLRRMVGLGAVAV